MTPRANPLDGFAILGGERWNVVDLSLGGIRLRSARPHPPPPDPDAPQRLDLLFGSPPIRTMITVGAKLRWSRTADDGTIELGLQFVDLDPAVAEAIDRTVGLALEAGEETLPATTRAAGLPSGGKSPPLASPPFGEPRRTGVPLWRFALAFAAIATVGALLLASIYAAGEAAFALRATYAAVTAETETLRAPVAGRVMWEPVVAAGDGHRVAAGEVLGHLHPVLAQSVAGSLLPRIAMLSAREAELTAEEQAIRDALTGQTERARDLLAIVRDRMATLEEEVSRLADNHDAVRTLVRQNIATMQRLEQIAAQLSERRTDLSELKREERRILAELRELESGRLVTNERAVVRSLEAVRREAASVAAELHATKALLGELTAPVPLRAQAGGIVVQRLVDHGMLAEAAEPVLRLLRTDDGAQPRLQALLPADKARRLAPGDPATVVHGESGRILRATVARVSYSPVLETRFGLPSPRTLGYEAALVDIVPHGPLPDPRPGDAISVRFPFWSRIGNLPCRDLDWPETVREALCRRG